MHLYLIARAEKDRLQKWINDLSAQYYPMKFIDPKTNKIETGHAQVAVREIKLLEIAIPKEFEAEVMGMIRPSLWSKSFAKVFKPISWFAKYMGLKKPLPESEWKQGKNILYNQWVHAIALGTKDDIIQPLIEKEAQTEEKI